MGGGCREPRAASVTVNIVSHLFAYFTVGMCNYIFFSYFLESK